MNIIFLKELIILFEYNNGKWILNEDIDARNKQQIKKIRNKLKWA